MKLRLFQVDAFTDQVFSGNPAAVCPLDRWLDDSMLQAIAAENNLSETAFFVPGDPVELRWFTPTVEVELCGHATLATAFVMFNCLGHQADIIRFKTRSGVFGVSRENDLLTLDFPSRPAGICAAIPELISTLGDQPREIYAAQNLLAVFDTEAQIRALKPFFDGDLKWLGDRGIIVTAPGDTVDFVSRYFAPAHGIIEDPVTGSAHCTLAPYWAKRLNKTAFVARQVSARGGALQCRLENDRVLISGKAVLYLVGEITL